MQERPSTICLLSVLNTLVFRCASSTLSTVMQIWDGFFAQNMLSLFTEPYMQANKILELSMQSNNQSWTSISSQFHFFSLEKMGLFSKLLYIL